MKKLFILALLAVAFASCTAEEIPETTNEQSIDKDKYQVPPNGVVEDAQGIDKDKYQVPPNG